MAIKEVFPTAEIKVDEPKDELKGVWHIDAVINGHRHMIGLRCLEPIGYNPPDPENEPEFGTGWEETFKTFPALLLYMRKVVLKLPPKATA